MKYFGDGLSEKHKQLRKIIRKKHEIGNAQKLFFEIHRNLHLSEVYGDSTNETDRLFSGLTEREYCIMPTAKAETIAWVLWHITRIEDLTLNILVAETDQVFNKHWQEKLNVSITDTGNALSDNEIMDLSRNMNITQLQCYRNAVGKRTQNIVKNLTGEDMKQKVSPKNIERIHLEGGVTEQEESIWLLDFWGHKDIAGILLMPPTRHVIMHLNACAKWKKHIRDGKKIFLTE